MPYYWDLNHDKDFTLTSRFFASEHPLFLGEYRQAFKSNLIFDFGPLKVIKIQALQKHLVRNLIFSKFVKILRVK